MSYIIAGAVVFAVGSLFGAWLTLAGQQSQKGRTSQKFQDAFLKTLERANERKGD